MKKKFKVVYVSNCRGENYPTSMKIKKAYSGKELAERLLDNKRDEIIKQIEEEEGALDDEKKETYLEFYYSTGVIREGAWWVEDGEEDYIAIIEEGSAFYDKVDKFIDGCLEEDEWEEWNEFTEPCT